MRTLIQIALQLVEEVGALCTRGMQRTPAKLAICGCVLQRRVGYQTTLINTSHNYNVCCDNNRVHDMYSKVAELKTRRYFLLTVLILRLQIWRQIYSRTTPCSAGSLTVRV